MTKVRAITYSIGNKTYLRSVGYSIETEVDGMKTRFTISEINEIKHKKETWYEIWIKNADNELALWKRIFPDSIEIEYDNCDLLTF
jgi:hypothetical protein